MAGCLAGLVATGPMTLALELVRRGLPGPDAPFPPKEVTMGMARKVGLKRHMDEETEWAATWAAHFGYGSGVGAVYGAIAPRVPWPAVPKGMAYGVAVWALSYLGWLPAVGIVQPLVRRPVRQQTALIVAHLVWGAATGALTEVFRGRAGPPRTRPRAKPEAARHPVSRG